MRLNFRKYFDVDFPLFAFSHCRDVVAAVTNAGGIGILGAGGMSPTKLDVELQWIDEKTHGRPYGVDFIFPTSVVGRNKAFSAEDLSQLIPDSHREFIDNFLELHDISHETSAQLSDNDTALNYRSAARGEELLDVVFSHPIKLIANALGVPPRPMLERGKANEVAVAALVGTREQAIKQAEAGVDIIVAQGTEAGGHCGEISTLVLVPEIIGALSNNHDISVLAAGGIVTGRQMAACMALGAAGVWTGSVWLTAPESETAPIIKEKLITASSSDTIRTRGLTGKPARALKSQWSEVWETDDCPAPLPSPLQMLIAEPARIRIEELAERGHPKAREIATYFVGQGVGMMKSSQSARHIVQEFREDFATSISDLYDFVGL